MTRPGVGVDADGGSFISPLGISSLLGKQAHRQSEAIAGSADLSEDQAFVDAVPDLGGLGVWAGRVRSIDQGLHPLALHARDTDIETRAEKERAIGPIQIHFCIDSQSGRKFDLPLCCRAFNCVRVAG